MSPPDYVKINGNGASLRRTGSTYYRDAGQWAVGYRYDEGVLVAAAICENTKHLDGIPLIECSKEVYEIDNQGYC